MSDKLTTEQRAALMREEAAMGGGQSGVGTVAAPTVGDPEKDAVAAAIAAEKKAKQEERQRIAAEAAAKQEELLKARAIKQAQLKQAQELEEAVQAKVSAGEELDDHEMRLLQDALNPPRNTNAMPYSLVVCLKNGMEIKRSYGSPLVLAKALGLLNRAKDKTRGMSSPLVETDDGDIFVLADYDHIQVIGPINTITLQQHAARRADMPVIP